MLSKKHRATTAQVNKVIAKGRTKHSLNFTVRLLSNSLPTTSVVVSKKIAANAVGRNKLKRRVRMALRSIIFPKDTTFVIYLKKGAKKLPFPELKAELQVLIQ